MMGYEVCRLQLIHLQPTSRLMVFQSFIFMNFDKHGPQQEFIKDASPHLTVLDFVG